MAQSAPVFPINNSHMPNPKQGARLARWNAQIVNGVASISVLDLIQDEKLDQIQTIFVDNSAGANPVTVTTELIRQRLVIPAGAQARLAFSIGGDSNISVSRTDDGTLPIFFYNIAMPEIVWDADGSVIVVATATVTFAGCTVATPANVTMTGASVQLFAANANAKVRTIYNDSGADIQVNFGAAASSTAFVTTIADGGYYEFPQPLFVGVVNAIGAGVGDVRVMEQAL